MENVITKDIADRFIKAIIEVFEEEYNVNIEIKLKEKEAK